MEDEKKRKRGGQPGNLNRVRHGFYSKRLRSMQIEEAQQMDQNLNEEVALMRACLAWYIAKAKSGRTAKERRETLDGAGLATVRIGYLVQTNRGLTEQMDAANMPEVILQVLADMALERKGRLVEARRLDERVEAGDPTPGGGPWAIYGDGQRFEAEALSIGSGAGSGGERAGEPGDDVRGDVPEAEREE
jgi:hypothetical protein